MYLPKENWTARLEGLVRAFCHILSFDEVSTLPFWPCDLRRIWSGRTAKRSSWNSCGGGLQMLLWGNSIYFRSGIATSAKEDWGWWRYAGTSLFFVVYLSPDGILQWTCEVVCLQEVQFDTEENGSFSLPAWLKNLDGYAACLPGDKYLTQMAERNERVLANRVAIGCAVLFRSDRLVQREETARSDPNRLVSACLEGHPESGIRHLGRTVFFLGPLRRSKRGGESRATAEVFGESSSAWYPRCGVRWWHERWVFPRFLRQNHHFPWGAICRGNGATMCSSTAYCWDRRCWGANRDQRKHRECRANSTAIGTVEGALGQSSPSAQRISYVLAKSAYRQDMIFQYFPIFSNFFSVDGVLMFGHVWTYLYLNLFDFHLVSWVCSNPWMPWMPWMLTLPGPTRSAYDHGMSEGPCVTWSLVFWLTGGRNPRSMWFHHTTRPQYSG